MVLDVIIESGSDWPTFLIGLLGVIVGTLALFLVEIWRQVLVFRAAGLYVATEMLISSTKTRTSIKQQSHSGPEKFFPNSAWSHSTSSLAAVLDRQNFAFLAKDYAIMEILNDYPDTHDRLPSEVYKEIAELLATLDHLLEDHLVMLFAYLAVPRWRVFSSLILDRPPSIGGLMEEGRKAAEEMRGQAL